MWKMTTRRKSATGFVTDEKTPSKKQKLLAHIDGEWVMCTLIKTKENGKHKVKLKGGNKVVVPSDGVKPL